MTEPQKGQKLVPQLRFKGFNDPWEQRKLSQLLGESRIKGEKGDIARKLTVKLWGKGVVEKTSVDVGSKATQYFVRNAGQLMYGKLDFLHAAFGLVPQELDGFESTADSPAFDFISDVNKQFVLMSCLRKPFYLYQGSLADGSRKAKRVHVPAFLAMYINTPSVGEQNKISQFFKTLDDLIAACERKCELLEKRKRYYLQQIFSQKLRFKGFADSWQERKLKNIAEIKTKKNLDSQVTETFTNSAEKGIVSQRDFFDKDISNSDNIQNYSIVDPDDFVYNPRISTSEPYGPIRKNNLNRSGAMSPLYTIFTISNVDLNFIEAFFKSSIWHKFIYKVGDSGARFDRVSVSSSTFFEMPVKLPSRLEQNKISVFLGIAEKQYLLSQKQLDCFRKSKKYFLSRLFV